MANGAGRLFNIMKQTGEATNTSPSQIITLTVKSINPLVFQRDDRLEIPEDFCTFTDDDAAQNLAVDDKVKAIVLNDGQDYYIQLGYSGGGDGDMKKSVYDTNNNGIVDNAEKVNNHTVNKDVPSDAQFTDTTYNDATTSTSGLMSSSDKTKLDGIENGANKTTKTSQLQNDSNFVEDANYVHTDNNYTSTEKSKLSGIENGANKTVIDSILNNSSTNPVQNKIIYEALQELSSKLDNVFEWDGTTSNYNPDNIELFQSVYDKQKEKNCIVFKNTGFSSYYSDIYFIGKGTFTNTTSTSITKNVVGIIKSTMTGTYSSYNSFSVNYSYLYVTIQNDLVTNVSTSSFSPNIKAISPDYNYGTPYTPQYPGSPATKKYVDDKILDSDDVPVGTEVIYNGDVSDLPDDWEVVSNYTNTVAKLYLTGNNIDLTASSNYDNVRLPLTGTSIIGNKLSFDTTNKQIIIGENVHHIKISAQMVMSYHSTNKLHGLRIAKNNGSTEMVASYKYITDQSFESFCIPSSIFEVSPGDKIEAYVYIDESGGTVRLRSYNESTFLQVEVVE